MPPRKISTHLPDPEKQRRGKLGQQKKAEMKRITTTAESTTSLPLSPQDVTTTPVNSIETANDELIDTSPADKQVAQELMEATREAMEAAAQGESTLFLDWSAGPGFPPALAGFTPAPAGLTPAPSDTTKEDKTAIDDGTSKGKVKAGKKVHQDEAGPPAAKKRKGNKDEQAVVRVGSVELMENDGNIETQVYTSEHGQFTLNFRKTNEEHGETVHIWDVLNEKANQLRPTLKEEIFGAPFSQEELRLLDLRSASELFPSLVNKDGELRSRAIKVFKATSLKDPKAFAKRLLEKADVFKDMASAARKQETRFREAADKLQLGNKDTKEAKELLNDEPSLWQLLQATKPTMSAHDWNKRATHLEEHLNMLAEQFRQDLSVLTTYIRRGQENLAAKEAKIVQLMAYAQGAVKDERPAKHFFPELVTYLAPGVHLCECEKCGKANINAPDVEMEDEVAPQYDFPFLDIEATDRDSTIIKDAVECLRKPRYDTRRNQYQQLVRGHQQKLEELMRELVLDTPTVNEPTVGTTEATPAAMGARPRDDDDVDWSQAPKILPRLTNPFEDLVRAEEHGEGLRLFNLEDELMRIPDKSAFRARKLQAEIDLIKTWMEETSTKSQRAVGEAPQWVPDSVSEWDRRVAEACQRRNKQVDEVIIKRQKARLAITDEETGGILQRYSKTSMMDLTAEQTKEWQENIDARTMQFPTTIADVRPNYEDYLL